MAKKKPKLVKQDTRDFQQHPQLVLDIFRRQAGSLWKALLEGEMNGIDARASRIDITLDRDKFTIEDNGCGFQSQEELDKYFSCVGQPHVESEAKIFGRFRMGRGQIFSYGVNEWVSNQFTMSVDLQTRGLQHDVCEYADKLHAGCKIKVQLYEPLSNLKLQETIDEFTEAAKYVNLATFINGQQINKSPCVQKWDEETDLCYIKLRDTGNLTIYNQGVRIQDLSYHRLGTGGEVVSKVPVKVNFARNDIMSDCPVWKDMRKLVDKLSGVVRKKSVRLSADDRLFLARNMVQQALTGVYNHANDRYDVETLLTNKVFKCTNGRYWALKEIRNRFDGYITAAPKDSHTLGDKLMQSKACFAIGPSGLRMFNVSSVAELLELVAKLQPPHMRRQWLQEADWDELTEGWSEKFTLIGEKEWTLTQRLMVRLLRKLSAPVLRCYPREGEMPKPRLITLGNSDGKANAWTDGSRYIAFDASTIQRYGTNPFALFKYATLLIHEYCHELPSSGTHNHTPEFYELYHDWTRHRFFDYVMSTGISELAKVAKSLEKKLTKPQLAQLDRIESAAKLVKRTDNAERIAANLQ
jgi:hypothetical protein